jgi:hypothetical protein
MNAQEIVAVLNDAQRRQVLGAMEADNSNGILVLPLVSDGGALNRSLVDLGIAGYSSRGAALNRLGKDVRRLLKGGRGR